MLAAGFSRVGIARLRLDRAAAAFPEIHQFGFFADLVGELETDEADEDWAGPDALKELDAAEINRVVAARLRRRISAIMGYSDDGAVDITQPLTELGLDSLMAVRMRNTIRGDFGVEPPVALLLQGASLADLALDLIRQLGLAEEDTSERPERLAGPGAAARRSPSTCRVAAEGGTTIVTSSTAGSFPPNAVAVIGMAGRFPGANSVSAYWRNLRNGVESIVDLSEEDLLAAGVTERALANRSYVRRAALMSGIEEFDADFFGFTPYAARMLDPQHRLFLQTTFHALEDAGYDPAGLEATVGVFGTSSASGYLLHNLMSNYDPMMVIGQGASFEMVNLSLQNDKDHLATRVAHQFDFRGPALAVATACSSSLVAVHLACQSHPQRRVRHRAGRRLVAAGAASRRVLVRAGLHGLADRALQAVRRPLRRHHLRQRRRRRRPQGAAGRDRRRRPHPRRDPRFGDSTTTVRRR